MNVFWKSLDTQSMVGLILFYLLKWLKINTINAIKLNQPQAIKIWLEQFSLLNSRLLFIFLWNVISNSDEFLFLQKIHETILVLTQPPDWSCTCIEWWNDFFHFTDSVPKVIIVISWLGRRQSWLKSFLSANWTFLWLGFFFYLMLTVLWRFLFRFPSF